MSGHTPGPWKASSQAYPGGRWTEWYVESEPGCYVWNNDDGYSGSADEADAHLIAAAPELLEAARAMVEAMGSYAEHTRNGLQLLHAIAKAEGRTP